MGAAGLRPYRAAPDHPHAGSGLARRVDRPRWHRAGRLGSGDTEHGTHRQVAIPSGLVADLEEHLAEYAAPGRDDWFFVGPEGGPVQSSHFRTEVWQPALSAVGLSELPVHDLRHHAATSVATLPGANTKDVQTLLGHEDPMMAIRHMQSSAARQAELAEAAAQLRLASVTTLRRSA